MMMMKKMMRMIMEQILQGELLVSWVSGLDRVEDKALNRYPKIDLIR